MNRAFLFVVVVLSFLSSSSATAASAEDDFQAQRIGAFRFRRIAMIGDPAPDLPGRVFVRFGNQLVSPGAGAPSVDARGNFGIVGSVDDGAGDLTGMWKEIDGDLRLITLQGDPAPGTTTSFDGFPSPLFELPPTIALEKTIFNASVSPGIGSLYGVWTDRYGSVEMIAVERDPIPNMPLNAAFRSPIGLVFDDGMVLLDAQYFDDDDGYLQVREQEGFWRHNGAALSLLIRDDMHAPGTPEGVVFGDAQSLHNSGPFDRWDTSDSGILAFNGTLRGPGVGLTTDEGVWIEGANGLELVVRESDPAPEIQPGFQFGIGVGIHSFGAQYNTHIKVNNNGSLLFGAGAHGNGYDHVDSLWKYRAGQLELVAVTEELFSGFPGQQAPGLPQGVKFTNFFLHASINNQDQVAFQGFTPDDDGNSYTFESGIWWDQPGELALVARTETPVPGIGGAEFDLIQLIELLDNGRMTMSARLTGPSITTANDNALFLAGGAGTMQLVLREGDAIDVAGDGSDLRVVESFLLGGVNERLEMGLLVHFTDGTSGNFEAYPDRRKFAQRGLPFF